MPAWLSALLVAFWEIVKPWVMPAGAAVVGAELQKGRDAQRELAARDKADAAANAADGLSRDDKLQFLERRKRVRGAESVH